MVPFANRMRDGVVLGLMIGFNFQSIYLKMGWRSMGLALPITGALLNIPMHLLC
jgi:hypothetical protein